MGTWLGAVSRADDGGHSFTGTCGELSHAPLEPQPIIILPFEGCDDPHHLPPELPPHNRGVAERTFAKLQPSLRVGAEGRGAPSAEAPGAAPPLAPPLSLDKLVNAFCRPEVSSLDLSLTYRGPRPRTQ